MPRIKSFQIKNFKGIKKTTIALDDRTDNPVITLIGLNESGKTTVLEALSNFVSNDTLVSSLFKPVRPRSTSADIIPISQRAAFTDNIEISAIVELDSSDISAVVALAASHGLEIDIDKMAEPFHIVRTLYFVDSVHEELASSWGFELWGRTKAGYSYEEIFPESSGEGLWFEVADIIEKHLPSIAYFPTFLVDIPNKIYLTEHDKETTVNRHYRTIFQSIMDGVDGGLDLKRHVAERINTYVKRSARADWLTQFMTSDERSNINAVFKKVSNSVTKEVIGGWRRVFSKETTAKNISIDWNIDTNKDNIPYASFQVSDGESQYEISERSLGFRWFFSFLLFTAFKGKDNKPTIYIFDEPAANLHAKAQAELLESFGRIATGGSKIIYSTHSHHMINPRWLGGAYIIENTALNVDADDDFGSNVGPTNIKATKYREFLSSYPSRSSYFQPVIESLEYVTPELIGAPPFVLVEGISDYYALTLAQKISKMALGFRLIPGVGSGACGPLISQMMGRGEDFLILLDDDAAGRKECIRYRDGWYLNQRTVFTLSAIDEGFSGKALESLFDLNTMNIIKGSLEISTPPSKKQIGWYLAESCASVEVASSVISREALECLVKVLEFLNARCRVGE